MTAANRYTGTSRKSHRKSRLGCGNCKRRRVKCDEIKPTCTNCLRHSIECDYQASRSVSCDTPPSTQDEELQSESSSSRNSPSKNYTFYSSSQSDFSPPKRGHVTRASRYRRQQQEPSPAEFSSALTHRSFEFTMVDMELFHHFLASEDLAWVKSREDQTMRSRLSRLGFSYHYILRLILAFSGFHLARIQGHGSNYYAEAERHYENAVKDVSAAIPNLDNQNCHALYMAAVLIFICSFARGPSPDEFLAFRDDGNAGSLSLFLGVRSILENCRSFLSTDVLSIHQGATEHNSQPSSPCHNGHVSGYGAQIEQLHGLITAELAVDEHRHVDHTNALDRLHRCFDSIYGSQLPLTDGELWPRIFGWLYTLPDAFVVDLRHRRPVAMVIFAFYAALLKRISFTWFICGWPEHIMSVICRFIDEGYRPYIQWPMEQIK